jgi:sulfur carrier protein
MDIRLNGETLRLAGSTLAELLALHEIDPAKPGVAVAINAAVVPRTLWLTTALQPGDEVEIVRPHSGG